MSSGLDVFEKPEINDGIPKKKHRTRKPREKPVIREEIADISIYELLNLWINESRSIDLIGLQEKLNADQSMKVEEYIFWTGYKEGFERNIAPIVEIKEQIALNTEKRPKRREINYEPVPVCSNCYSQTIRLTKNTFKCENINCTYSSLKNVLDSRGRWIIGDRQ